MLLLVPMLFSLASQAACPPRIDPAKFAATTKLAAETGEVLQGDNYDFHVLKHLTPSDPSKTHRAEYFSDIGITDPTGRFTPSEISLVSENWQKQKNGDWVIDQWIWEATLEGEPYGVNHFRLTENKDGSVLDDVALPTGKPGDPEELARFVKKYNSEWGMGE